MMYRRPPLLPAAPAGVPPLLLLLVSCALLSWLSSGCAVQTKQPYVKDGRKYGVTRGFVWRPTWWNFYERGVSFAEGEYWEDAVEDLVQAIALRDKDQRMARTYGMHFIDYFPHRELGVVYFLTGRYQEAILELEQSLSMEESAKAEYFLNRSRKRWLEEMGLDLHPPVVLVRAPPDGYLTRELSLEVRGVIQDDRFASGVSVNGVEVPIFLARKEVPFSLRVALNPGQNRLRLVARDLVGKTTESEIRVTVDRAGPLVYVERLEIRPRPAATEVLFAGELADAVGLASFKVQGGAVQRISGKRHRFEHRLELPPGQCTLAVEARDQAGNVTHGTLFVCGEGPGPEGRRARLACRDDSATDVRPLIPLPSHSARGGAFAALEERDAGTASSLPGIRLRDLPESPGALAVYYDSLLIEGDVGGPVRIASLRINGAELLEQGGRRIFFSYLARLDKGENRILIEASDQAGHKARRVLTVVRKTPSILDPAHRLRMSILPLGQSGGTPYEARLATEDLLACLVEQQRFCIVERERLDEVAGELRLSLSRLVDKKAALRLGRLLGAEAILSGSVQRSRDSMEVVAYVVDAETSKILLVKDAFGQVSSLAGTRKLMEALAYKLRQGLPLLEGRILRCEKGSYYLSSGKDMGVRPFQKILFYREGPEIRHPITGFYLGRRMIIVAEGRIREVYDDVCVARMSKTRHEQAHPLPTDSFITK